MLDNLSNGGSIYENNENINLINNRLSVAAA